MQICKDVLSSRQNEFVKMAASLADKKGREREGKFLCEGLKLTEEAAKAKLPVTDVVISESKREALSARLTALFSSAVHQNTRLVTVSDDVFSKISTEKSNEGVISIVKYLDFFRKSDIIYKDEFISSPEKKTLALCSLQDPGNVGAVIRSAAAFGVDRIILSADSADVYHPRTVRAAMGTLFKVEVRTVGDFSSFVRAARDAGRKVYAAELRDGAVSLDGMPFSPSDIFIIGNEGHGIPSQISSLCDGSVYIPISENAESLNAAVAAAVLMWHIR